MIVTLAELGYSAAIWLGSEIHSWGKGHAAAQQQLILDKKEYCPPVYKLPADLSDWQKKQYESQCEGVQQYLQDKVPEVRLLTPQIDAVGK